MGDPFFDPTNNLLKSDGNEYQNLAILDPNAPAVGGNEPPPPPPPLTVAQDALISDNGAKVTSGDGVQKLPESNPSLKKPRGNKAKIKKLKNKIEVQCTPRGEEENEFLADSYENSENLQNDMGILEMMTSPASLCSWCSF